MSDAYLIRVLSKKCDAQEVEIERLRAELAAERVLCESYLLDNNQITQAWVDELDRNKSLRAELAAERKLRNQALDDYDARLRQEIASRAELAAANAEVEKLRERLGPRGLVVVKIGETGHYVAQKVADEIERLRDELAAEQGSKHMQQADAGDEIADLNNKIVALRDELAAAKTTNEAQFKLVREQMDRIYVRRELLREARKWLPAITGDGLFDRIAAELGGF